MSSPRLLLLLLLVSLVTASHYYGGSMTFTAKGKNPDGTFKVVFRYRETYDFCSYSGWNCYSGNCGYQSRSVSGTIDTSTSGKNTRRNYWCESETVMSRNVPSNKPFQMQKFSCCWISTVNRETYWKLLTVVDLGTRSDTSEPNRSPDTAILPFIRVPQNCPRKYNLMSSDPDGDRVRCRYGISTKHECFRCSQPSGFSLDQDSCTLQYGYTSSRGVYGFELVVEDFPTRLITLSYSDGSSSSRAPLTARGHKWTATTTPPTTYQPTTTTYQPTTTPLPWWWPQPTTTPLPWWWPQPNTTPSPWWWPQTTTIPMTTPPSWYQPNTTPSPWWWPQTTTIPMTTTTGPPTPPLSKLPLQFSLLVDQPAPSCTEGEYLPRFLPPTPHNGDRLHTEVGKEMEIRVKAQATHSTVYDVIISGPLNMTKHTTTHGEFVLRWTPVQDDLGDHLPICFIAEAAVGNNVPSPSPSNHQHFHPVVSQQSNIYQSEMRCVVVEVGRKKVIAKVSCSETSITVEVEKSSLSEIHEDHLQLSDPSSSACDLQRYSNSTHVVAVIPLNACGTQIEEDDENLIFKNEITTFDNPADIITRRHQVELEFNCQYAKRGNVTQSYSAHRDTVTVSEKGFGTFMYQFEFFQSSHFLRMVDPRSYPVEVDVKQMIYMQIEATSSVNNTELFVESCRAAPYDNPNYHPTYTIRENGCNVDETVIVFSPDHERHFQFGMEAFKFIGLHDQVYISCTVIVCEAGNPKSRCSQGCLNSTSSWSGGHHHHHRKRDAGLQTGIHYVSQGPLRLRRSSENPATNLNLNLNLVFFAGCLLATVAMVCGVVIYKAKGSRVKYQPLKSFET